MAMRITTAAIGVMVLAGVALAKGLGPEIDDAAPAAVGADLEGREVALQTLRQDQPVVVIFLRGYPGYQCPLCSKQVASFIAAADTLAPARVLMIYPGPAEALADHAKTFVRGKDLPDTFDLIIDPDYTITNAWRLRWDKPKETAYPSTFVVDTEGRIRFAKVSTSHGGRSSVEEVAAALAKLKPASTQPAGDASN
jgi:thioredoxin-dependent peroxiredoxin